MGEWYVGLNKAPWTPPGWVFGASWTTIMVCLTIYMAYAWEEIGNRKDLLVYYGIQLILNFTWNPIFFQLHEVLTGLIVISALTILMFYILWKYKDRMGQLSWLLAPYCIWLVIATSLNAYVFIYN